MSSPFELLATLHADLVSNELRSLVAARLEQGEKDYGDSYLQWREGQVVAEIKEELADVFAYALLELSRLGHVPSENWEAGAQKMMEFLGAANALFDLTTGETE